MTRITRINQIGRLENEITALKQRVADQRIKIEELEKETTKWSHCICSITDILIEDYKNE